MNSVVHIQIKKKQSIIVKNAKFTFAQFHAFINIIENFMTNFKIKLKEINQNKKNERNLQIIFF